MNAYDRSRESEQHGKELHTATVHALNQIIYNTIIQFP
jgi:hypothetical protein